MFVESQTRKIMPPQPYNQYEPYTDVLYWLTGYHFNYPEEQCYPTVYLFMGEESLHRTLEDAKERIRALVAEEQSEFYRWHSFYIDEIPFGVECHSGFDGQKRWSFMGSGELNAHKWVSSIEDRQGNTEIFWGREPEDCRFMVGDIVEVPSSDNSVTLGIVTKMPVDFEEAAAELPDEKPDEPMRFHCDERDDCYQVITMEYGYPRDTDVVRCFPATTFPIDRSYISELRKLAKNRKR